MSTPHLKSENQLNLLYNKESEGGMIRRARKRYDYHVWEGEGMHGEKMRGVYKYSTGYSSLGCSWILNLLYRYESRVPTRNVTASIVIPTLKITIITTIPSPPPSY
jgi:hypothetical protein